MQPPAESDERWRPEEIGHYDGTGDAQAFVKSVANFRGHRLVQAILVTLFKADKDNKNRDENLGFNWYHCELKEDEKAAFHQASSMDPWCDAIMKRFGPRYIDIVSKLGACSYTRRDATNKEDATGYIQKVLRLSKGLHSLLKRLWALPRTEPW